ncbi:IclR family transcriptional regulator [Halococcus morrhuae DSM 1307]|uniref:IclR family transcriptional regulator n=1 Tax=Halococcus morrhuae DSM 1307 TaxID=931277 RepID=M0M7G5_HALMO|nr:IclR family transcriptional regulator [Halococcus morrhuae]EMA41343.1 IclR family transcriptional regulator [Halococcus morrhuae DSM 1307]
MDASDTVPIQSLRTAKDIVDFLVENDGAGVTETAERIDRPLSTTHEYLNTLTEIGYLIRGDDGYYVSSLHLSVGTEVRSQDPLYAAAKPEIDKFAAETDNNIVLLKEESGYGVTLYSVENDDSMRIQPRAGNRNYLHINAGGKAILASLPHERVEAIVENVGLDAVTENTITDRETLFEELETIREVGYAVSREEDIVGIHEIAIPILVEDARNIGSILVYGPASEFTDERLTEELPEALRRLKNVLEFNLTYAQYSTTQ